MNCVARGGGGAMGGCVWVGVVGGGLFLVRRWRAGGGGRRHVCVCVCVCV